MHLKGVCVSRLLGALDFLAIAEISSDLTGSQVFEKVSNEIDYASYGTNQGFLNDSGALNPLSCRESNDVMHAPGTAGGSGFHQAHPPHPAGDFSPYIIGGSPPHTRALLN